MQAAMGSEQVQREMKAKQRAIAEHDLPYVKPSRIRHHEQEREADAELRKAARRFEEELMLLADQGGAQWDRMTSAGKLNAQRAMDPHAELDELFDSWSEEGEGHDLEVVTLVDNSSSMDSRNMGAWGGYGTPGVPLDKLAGDCAWILDRGVKSVEGSHTAITFGEKTGSLYRPEDRPTRGPLDIEAKGGTDPLDALTQAVGILRSSKRRNKVLIIITDGAWNGRVANGHELIRVLRGEGVQTALAYLSAGASQDIEGVRHECEKVDIIPDAGKLPGWGAQVVAEAMKKKARR